MAFESVWASWFFTFFLFMFFLTFLKKGRDITADYNRIVFESMNHNFNSLPANAKDYVYLLVPGLFTNHYPGYMNQNIEGLRSHGLDARKLQIDTGLGVDANAVTVRDEILTLAKEGKKIILIGHSKGGVDAAAAIAKFNLYDHITAFIPVQVVLNFKFFFFFYFF